MGFLELPKQLTEEEKILQQKYQKLKRKKKALQALKTPKPEQPPVQPLKRVSESGPKQDAKELAKKLLRTGAIAAIKAPEKREAFRRSKAVERKRAGDHKPGGYQPFSSTQSSDGGESDNLTPEPISPLKAQYSSKYSLYENFVSPKDAEVIAREETNRERRRDGKANYVNRDVPHQGNTVYVRGTGINESVLRPAFAPFGQIMNINVEIDKNCGFITFENIDEANMAIDQMNKKTVDGIELQVSIARRQPHVAAKAVQEQSSVAAINSWSAIATTFSRKVRDGNKAQSSDSKETREQIVYDDLF